VRRGISSTGPGVAFLLLGAVGVMMLARVDLGRLRPKIVAPSELQLLAADLQSFDGHTHELKVSDTVMQFANRGALDRNASQLLVAIASNRSKLFAARDKHEVTRLRAFMLSRLADMEMPDSAIPLIAEQLDNAHDPLTVACAVRAAGALPANREIVVPGLVRALEVNFSAQLVDIENYDPSKTTPGELTTPGIEALRSLRRIGRRAASAVPAIQAIVDRSASGTLFERRLHAEAAATLSAIALKGQ
jgi:hypothetical protein